MRAPQRPVDAAGQGRVLSCHGARFIRSATSEASADDGAPTRWRGHARIVLQRVHCPWAVEPEEAGETEGLAQPQLACVPATARSVPSAERSGAATARGTGRAATAGRSAPTTRTHSCCRRLQSLRSAAYWPGNAAGSLRATPGLSRHAALRAAACALPREPVAVLRAENALCRCAAAPTRSTECTVGEWVLGSGAVSERITRSEQSQPSYPTRPYRPASRPVPTRGVFMGGGGGGDHRRTAPEPQPQCEPVPQARILDLLLQTRQP